MQRYPLPVVVGIALVLYFHRHVEIDEYVKHEGQVDPGVNIIEDQICIIFYKSYLIRHYGGSVKEQDDNDDAPKLVNI